MTCAFFFSKKQAGDVLVFPMDLLHGSCTNRSPARRARTMP
jgi:ectoine hydroxylase-related dioxygenase (phytanoyl-CoA dioxygenase family)